MKRDLYAVVSARIIAELEAGALPWIKSWAATPGAKTPCNAVTNRLYFGCNVVLLWMAQAASYRTPRYLTFKQALELGGHVRKGERGTKAYFVKQHQVRDPGAQGDATSRPAPIMREYTVFNVDQCEGFPDHVTAEKPARVRNPDTRDTVADEFFRSTSADARESHGEAYYVPSQDFPHAGVRGLQERGPIYGAAFHELTHWTGHKSRLDRDLKNRFGSRKYAAEELIAELGAAFLCAEFGFNGDHRHAGYLATWIDLRKADKRAFFTACSQASKAADYLRGLALAEPADVAA